MSITEQTYPIACRGGLDLSTNTQELLNKPGWATHLVNFEPSSDGGYRRINGYTSLGSGRTPGIEQTPIKGVEWVDGEMLLVCHEGSVYITYDLVNWAKVNKLMTLGVGGVITPGTSPSEVASMNYTELQAAAEVSRPNSDHYHFNTFRQGSTVLVMGSSGGHDPFLLIVEGTTLADSTYTYYELGLTSGSLTGALHSEKFKDQYVISGMDVTNSEIYYSDINAPWDFEGANAGVIGFNDTIKGLHMFRETLYVFCEHSIHKVTGLSSGSPLREPVTTRIGCLSGDSIQEIAGDLVFLSPDGLRTLGATTRIGDVNLSTLSDSIDSKLRVITRNINEYNVASEVLKSKVQYRIFFRPKVGSPFSSFSMIMHMGAGEQESLNPAFAEIQGFIVRSIDSGTYKGKERTVTGDEVGNLWFHDEGNTQDGTEITFLYQTPFFAINDPGMRKNIHKLITYIKGEGLTDFNIALKFDYDSSFSYQPAPYSVDTLTAPASYGSATYGTSRYGVDKSPLITTLTEGSGKTVAIRIFPSGERCDPFSLQGFDVYFIQSGRI